MSHVTTVDLEVNDLDALAEAAKRCGLELARGQETYRWYGSHVGDYPMPAGFTEQDLGKCDHALRIPAGDDPEGKAYEIGVVRRRDGRPGYQLLWDFFAGGYGLQQRVGRDCLKLRREYGAVRARRELLRQGCQVREVRHHDGRIQVIGIRS